MGMKSRIDKFGRVVIPRSLRERAALDTGVEVDIVESGGSVTIRPSHTTPVLTREEDGLLVLHAQLPLGLDPVSLDREERLRKVRGTG